jgi:hypothetical protein
MVRDDPYWNQYRGVWSARFNAEKARSRWQRSGVSCSCRLGRFHKQANFIPDELPNYGLALGGILVKFFGRHIRGTY